MMGIIGWGVFFFPLCYNLGMEERIIIHLDMDCFFRRWRLPLFLKCDSLEVSPWAFFNAQHGGFGRTSIKITKKCLPLEALMEIRAKWGPASSIGRAIPF